MRCHGQNARELRSSCLFCYCSACLGYTGRIVCTVERQLSKLQLSKWISYPTPKIR